MKVYTSDFVLKEKSYKIVKQFKWSSLRLSKVNLVPTLGTCHIHQQSNHRTFHTNLITIRNNVKVQLKN